jgi:hypothetical protein
MQGMELTLGPLTLKAMSVHLLQTIRIIHLFLPY